MSKTHELTPCHAGHGCIRAFEDDTCGDQDQCSIVLAIQAALADEREACAKIADNYENEFRGGVAREDFIIAKYASDETCVDIAERIRVRSQP